MLLQPVAEICNSWDSVGPRCTGGSVSGPRHPTGVESGFRGGPTGGWWPFRALTILDVFTRESLAIEVGQHLNGGNVVGVLNLRGTRGAPKLLLCDNGSEFTSQSMDLWADHNRVQIDFSRLGKPTDNAYVESFNGTLRAECLDVHWFASLMEARQNIEACMHACAYQCHLRIINSPDLTIAQKRSWAVEMLRKDGSFICFSFEQRKACESDYLTVSLDRRFSIVMRRY